MNEKRIVFVCSVMFILLCILTEMSLAQGIQTRATGKQFYVGRYGRSGTGSSKNPNISSRNDKQFEKFFIGSRYGKRDGEQVEPSGDAVEDNNSVTSTEDLQVRDNIGMNCVYTGVMNLFRCSARAME